MLTVDDGKREIMCELLLELLDDELEDEDELLGLELELDVELEDVELDELGVGVGVGVCEGEALEDPEDELEADESPAGNKTTFAVAPEGIVTTQNAAPPAPSAESELVTSFIALTAGSMEQGRPLQPEPLHSTLRPKVGLVLLREQPVKMGLYPILKKVSPFESVLPPITYGAQFPIALDPSPQTQPSSVLTPGGLT